MGFTPSTARYPSARALGLLGRALLGSGLCFGLVVTLFLAWAAPTLLPLFVVALGALPMVWWLFDRPMLNLCCLLVTFIVIAGYSDGTQGSEILWGLYYLAFLAHWFVTRLFLYRSCEFEDRTSRAIGLFVVLMTLSFGLTLMFGGNLRLFVGEWLSLSFLALYFPIREVMERYKLGAWAVIASVTVVGVLVLARNAMNYQQIIAEATFAWQLTKGRAVTNTAILMIPLFGSLFFLLHARTRAALLWSAVPFLLFFAGFIISQTRGHWLAFAVTCVVLLPVLRMPQRVRLVLVGLGALTILGGVGYLLLGDAFLLVAIGIIDRVLSIGTAASQDISLINRFNETWAVLALVKKNPILGYGMGFQFQFWDMTYLPPFTNVTSFLHNGFVALWFKFGIWGLGLVSFIWTSGIVKGIRLYRSSADMVLRVAGLAGAALLISYLVSAITSNPFYVNDTMYVFVAALGLVGGAEARARVLERGLVAP